MRQKLVSATVLAMVTLVAIGVTPVRGAVGESVRPVAETSAGEHWAEDPAALHLAAKKGVSRAEAHRRISVQQRASALDGALTRVLGSDRYGGVWIGTDDRIKVGILWTGTRAQVHRVAAVHGLAADTDVVLVRHSLAALLAAREWLSGQLARANKNAKWAMRVGYTTRGNTVRFGLPGKATGMTSAQRALLRQARHRYGSLLTTYTLTQQPRPDLDCTAASEQISCIFPPRGATSILGAVQDGDCTLGFLARSRSDNLLYGLTAGHCLDEDGRGASRRTPHGSGPSVPLGVVHNYVSGPNGDTSDAGIIRITNNDLLEQAAACQCSWVVVLASAGSTRNERYPIFRDGSSTDGMRVCMTGRVTGTSCGHVEELGVDGADGVRNVARANYCRAEGDSGGPVYAGNTAFGIHHAGDGPCEAFYQGIRGAEDLMRVDVVVDRATKGGVYYQHRQDLFSPGRYNYLTDDNERCPHRVRYGNFGNVAYAQARLYLEPPCMEEIERGVGIEVFGTNGGAWKMTSMASSQEDGCGRYVEIQATSPAGQTAAGMAIVTSGGRRVFYSSRFTDLPYNGIVGPACN